MEKNLFIKSIKAAKAQKDFDSMLEKAREAISLYPNDETLQALKHDAQAYYVNEKLHSELLQKLEEKEDWQGLQAVYLKLLSIFPESKKIHKLLEKVRFKIEKTAEKAKHQFYEDAKGKILIMIQEKKLEEAEQASYEILNSSPESKTFIHLLAKIQHLIDKEIENGLSLYYETAMPNLKKEYKTNKENFIRV